MGFKNKSDVDRWLEDDNLMLLECWARDGYTLRDIATRMGISPSTLSMWKDKYEEIDKAISKGKEVVDYKVENALLKSALGYTTKEIKVTLGKRIVNGQTVRLTKEVTTKEVAPNVTACLAWLNNRMPDKWKRNRDKEVLINDEESDVQITIVRAGKKDSDEEINKEIRLEKKKENEENSVASIAGEVENDKKIETQKDLDYWPDDWEEDE